MMELNMEQIERQIRERTGTCDNSMTKDGWRYCLASQTFVGVPGLRSENHNYRRNN